MDYEFIDVFKKKLLEGVHFPKRSLRSGYFRINNQVSCLISWVSGLRKWQWTNDTLPQFVMESHHWGWGNDYHQVSLKKALEPAFFW